MEEAEEEGGYSGWERGRAFSKAEWNRPAPRIRFHLVLNIGPQEIQGTSLQSDVADHRCFVYVCWRKNSFSHLVDWVCLNGPFSSTRSGPLWFLHDSQTLMAVPPSSDYLVRQSLIIYSSSPSHLRDFMSVVKKNSAMCLSHELGKQL